MQQGKKYHWTAIKDWLCTFNSYFSGFDHEALNIIILRCPLFTNQIQSRGKGCKVSMPALNMCTCQNYYSYFYTNSESVSLLLMWCVLYVHVTWMPALDGIHCCHVLFLSGMKGFSQGLFMNNFWKMWVCGHSTRTEESQHTFHFFAPQECPVAVLKMESVLERSRCWWMPSVWPFCPDCALHMCRECIQIKWWTLTMKILKTLSFLILKTFEVQVQKGKQINSCVCNYFFFPVVPLTGFVVHWVQAGTLPGTRYRVWCWPSDTHCLALVWAQTRPLAVGRRMRKQAVGYSAG